MKRLISLALMVGTIAVISSAAGFAAYRHKGDIDSAIFLQAYPDKTGTKLDSCVLCHSGGSYVSAGKTVAVGSCQWCHYAYGYDARGKIEETLNPYGLDYKHKGRAPSFLKAIEDLDSDGDGYANKIELSALRFPGDGADDPSKVPAPSRVFAREEIERLPQHTQLLLMNAHKSTDFYAKYTGIAMEDFLTAAGILSAATHIKVFAPDGFSQYHPLNPDPDPLFYHVLGNYPAAGYYYSEEADTAKNEQGWCDYSALAGMELKNNTTIGNPNGLKLMLAVYRGGRSLDPGILTPQNKLDGEGPFRVVPPQKAPGPPDQRATAAHQRVIWPFDSNADHNAGYSIRSATIVKVEPLPPGTTDIDTLEAGWNYVENAKIVVYGAVDPLPTIMAKMDALLNTLDASQPGTFKNRIFNRMMTIEVSLSQQLLKYGMPKTALKLLRERVRQQADGCSTPEGRPDADDWVADCDLQKKIFWDLNEIIVLLEIIA